MDGFSEIFDFKWTVAKLHINSLSSLQHSLVHQLGLKFPRNNLFTSITNCYLLTPQLQTCELT